MNSGNTGADGGRRHEFAFKVINSKRSNIVVGIAIG